MEEIQIISKNFAKGEVITNVLEIKELAEQKKSIYDSGCFGMKPAAIFMEMHLSMILYSIERQHFYRTIPIAKSRKYLVTEKKQK